MEVNLLSVERKEASEAFFAGKKDKKFQKNEKIDDFKFSSLFSLLLSDNGNLKETLENSSSKNFDSFKDIFDKSDNENKIKLTLDEFFGFIYLVKSAQEDFENKIVNFDKLSDILSDEKILKDFKQAKSLKELFSLAKKHGIKIKSFKSELFSNDIFEKEFEKLKFSDLFDSKSFKNSSFSNSLKSLELLTSLNSFRSSFKSDILKDKKIGVLENRNLRGDRSDILSSFIQNTKKVKDVKENVSVSKSNANENFKESFVKKENGIFFGDFKEKFLKKIESEEKIENFDFSKEFIDNEQEDIEIQKDKSEEMEDFSHQSVRSLKKEGENLVFQKNDVKKTFKTFAEDFKEAVKEYKPPVTKLNMTLKPKNLGEVEVVLFHRKDNLHVVINANQNTLSLFVQNQNDFKNALLNIGFGSFSMDFNDNSSGEREQKNRKNGGFFERNSENEEEEKVQSLKFIVPRYV